MLYLLKSTIFIRGEVWGTRPQPPLSEFSGSAPDSDKDPITLEAILQKDLGFANKWLASISMIASAREYLAIVSGSATLSYKLL